MYDAAAVQKELDIACLLARRAGEAILRHYEGALPVEYKDAGQSDPVTAADREANAIIVEGLRTAFPDDAVLAEESAASADRRKKSRLWCVDPIDGTRELIARNGQFAVMIGLAIAGQARLGVVFQPTSGTLFWGYGDQAGIEQFGERTLLHVSACGDPCQATVVTSRSHPSRAVARVAAAMGIKRVEPLGSVGLKVAAVARGRAELYISFSNRTMEWDACAPEAIVRASGGEMTDVLGEPLQYNKPSVETPHGMVASNGLLHPAVIAALRAEAVERRWI